MNFKKLTLLVFIGALIYFTPVLLSYINQTGKESAPGTELEKQTKVFKENADFHYTISNKEHLELSRSFDNGLLSTRSASIISDTIVLYDKFWSVRINKLDPESVSIGEDIGGNRRITVHTINNVELVDYKSFDLENSGDTTKYKMNQIYIGVAEKTNINDLRSAIEFLIKKSK